MSNVGYDTFFTKRPSTKFVVKNVTNEHPKWAPKGKRVRVFAYPIEVGDTRDLLSIPGVSEADIRHALLKGELQIKLDPNIRELIVVESDIDLLQFNDDQKLFLQQIGINKGLSVDTDNMTYPFLQDVELTGDKNSSNLIYTIPSGKFVYNSQYRITVYLNGVRQQFTQNYIIAESGGPGTGYDTIVFIVDAPDPVDVIVADYYQAQ